MKTKLLYVLLFISSLSFSQNWTQVGNAQFSEFASDVGKIAFNPNNGDVYVLYKNPIDSGMYVMKYDGSAWTDVGGVVSTLSYNAYAINVNPSTNQPWVLLKGSGGGSASNHNVYRFDGTNWTQEASGVAGSSYTRLTQIHFNSAGTARFTRVNSAGGPNRRVGYFTQSGANWVENDDADLGHDLFFDYTAFSEYFAVSRNVEVRKRTIDVSNSLSEVFSVSLGSNNAFRNVSGIAGENYYVASGITGAISFGNGNTTNLNQPSGTLKDGNKYLKLRKSTTDDGLYLMYKNNSDAITFESYNPLSTNWTNVTDPSIDGSASNFFADMGVNPVDGNVYVVYLDGAKASVKMYTVQTPIQLPRIYVDADATGSATGESWANAFTDIQTAINYIQPLLTTEIWVASGTYKAGTNRTDSFTITQDDLEVYGGFSGTEMNINERDITSNPTILSGDLDGDDDANITYNNTTRDDNSQRIINIDANNVVLDGFTITSGYADATSGEGRHGAGLRTAEDVENFTIKNCIIKDNVAWWAAGLALYSDVNNSNMTIDACVFENNLSSSSTSFYALPRPNRTMNVSVTNCLFKNNTSQDNGASRKASGSSAGWIRAFYSNTTINATVVNNTFVNNTNGGTNGGDYPTLGLSYTDGEGTLGTLTIANNIFWGNTRNGSTSLAIGGVTNSLEANMVVVNSIDEDNFSNFIYLSNTSNANPMFTDMANEDFTLQSGSPAIDTGDNSKVPNDVVADLLGNQRIFNTTVDMGVFEFGAPSLSTLEFEVTTNDIRVYPNPTTTTLNIQSNATITNVEVYDVLGKKVLESQETSIDVSTLHKGMYLLKVKSDNGVTTKRFVKR